MRGVSPVLATLAIATAHAAAPFPAALPAHAGLSHQSLVRPAQWGTRLPVSQDKWIKVRSTRATVEWGVCQQGGRPPTFPVRSTDGGHTWHLAGPLLATDWAGGSIYYVHRVISEGATAVVMVSNAVIDVTTDSGHHWYQYLNPADNWSITGASVSGGGIAIRVSPASNSSLPKSDFAVYRFDVSQHRWNRVSESVAVTTTTG